MEKNPFSSVSRLKTNDPTLAMIDLSIVPLRLISNTFIRRLADSLHINTFLTTICLRNCWLDHNDLIRLANPLACHPTLTSLDLSRNNICDSGVKHLAKALENSSGSLRMLYLDWNKVGDRGGERLRSCMLSNVKLTTVDLDLNPISPNLVLDIEELVSINQLFRDSSRKSCRKEKRKRLPHLFSNPSENTIFLKQRIIQRLPISHSLCQACAVNNMDSVKEILEMGVDPNEKCKYGELPLMIACEFHHIDIIKHLLDHDTKMVVDDTSGHTPLTLALQHYSPQLLEIINHLYQHDSTIINLADSRGWTPIMHALCENMDSVVVELLNLGSSLFSITLDGLNVQDLMKREDRRFPFSAKRSRPVPSSSNQNKRQEI